MGYSSKSPWVIHYDGSSCNGCDIEVLDSMTPLYDVERFGIINTGNPKHADIFLVTGSVNHQNQNVVRHIYDQMLEPKVVVVCGVCACTGGVFRECYNILGGVDKVIPVDVYAPGCAVRPETIIDAVLEGVKILDKKAELMKKGELKTLSSALPRASASANPRSMRSSRASTPSRPVIPMESWQSRVLLELVLAPPQPRLPRRGVNRCTPRLS